MKLHELKLFFCKLSGLVDDIVGNMYLSHIMKKARDINGILLSLRLSKPARYLLCVKRDPEGMSARISVLCVHHTHQGRDRLCQGLSEPFLSLHEAFCLDGNLSLKVLPVGCHKLLMLRSLSHIKEPESVDRMPVLFYIPKLRCIYPLIDRNLIILSCKKAGKPFGYI